jgi:large subunit ribosomal protein L15
MKIHELPGDPGRQQKIKRVGRGEGSGHGKTSGYGHKGSQARSGRGKGYNKSFEGGQMPITRRLPKGGFKNPFRVEYQVVNITTLEEHFPEGGAITLASLAAKGLANPRHPVKLLGTGEATRPYQVTLHKASESAVKKLEAAGGSFQVEA